MRRPLIAGNWKMNKNSAESIKLVSELREMVSDVSDVEIVVAPPFTALGSVEATIKDSNIFLSAQNTFWQEIGAFTGEISPSMLKDVGCQYTIIGHSERRQYFAETNETVNKRLQAALKASLTPIVCIGETLEEREAGKTLAVIEQQVREGLNGLSSEEMEKVVIAYEPVWAIGTGKTATPDQAQEVHKFIRDQIAQIFGEGVAENIRVLYGGSVKPDNIDQLMAQKDIDGALVGGASLKAESFARIVKFKT
ncbi:MAG: triosephosphate isomerase [Deltaproteobacteria bacterium DG_8]|nr:MAG: triosephosphate isomerase [Deltaproteobacteria bacterium DG_8]